jgi:prepilin-type N-terminal cleavage/methylation domain-containing protein
MKRAADRRSQRGVNLVELAISLAVMGIVAAGILVPLVTQVDQRNVLATETTIGDIKDALLGYAALNRRLPCPASTAANANGVEAFSGTGTAANGDCASFYGFVPGRTLGVTPLDSNGFVLDAWGNRIQYAVSGRTLTMPGGGSTDRAFTRTDGLRTATLPVIAYSAYTAYPPQLLQVCASGSGVTAATACYAPVPAAPGPTSPANELTTTAVVVIWSPGPNALTAGGTGTDEAQNPNPRNSYGSADVLFVSRGRSTVTANPFDDVVNWIGVNTLVSRMIAAGQLP